MDENSRKVANIAMIGWCFGVIASIFGFSSGIMQHRSLSIMFGIFLAPVMVMFYISSVTMGHYSTDATEDVSTICGETANKDSILASYIEHIDSNFSLMANKWMCSA